MQMKFLSEQACHHANHVPLRLTLNRSLAPRLALPMKTHHYTVALPVLSNTSLSRDLTSHMRYNIYVFLCMTPWTITCTLFDAFCVTFRELVTMVYISIHHPLHCWSLTQMLIGEDVPTLDVPPPVIVFFLETTYYHGRPNVTPYCLDPVLKLNIVVSIQCWSWISWSCQCRIWVMLVT